MKKILSLLIVFMLFLGVALNALAQDNSLPKAGLTPDSPFYFLEIAFEGIGNFFTFGNLNKAKRYAVLASERIAEAQKVAEQENTKATERVINIYKRQLNRSISLLKQAEQKGKNTEEVSESVANSTSRHIMVMEEVLEKVPEEAKKNIKEAKKNSMQGQRSALNALAQENPEQAAEINKQAVEGRLARAKAMAENGNSEETEEAVNEFKEYAKFGQEISEIAQKVGKDSSAVEELVSKATSIHLQVLADVYEKVPEQAKDAIEKAMEVSIQGHNRAVEALKQKGRDLEDISEEASIPEQVPEQARERIEQRVREMESSEEGNQQREEVQQREEIQEQSNQQKEADESEETGAGEGQGSNGTQRGPSQTPAGPDQTPAAGPNS